MKNVVLFFLAIVVLASCSTPRYTASFQNVSGSYASSHTVKNAVAPKTPVASVVVADAAPVVLASANNTPVAVAKIATKQTETQAIHNLTKSEKRTLIKESKSQIKASLKEIKKAGKAEGKDKSRLAAILLSLFLGEIGVHRFYLGYTWQGIVQIITLGGLGVWALIDFIRICVGTLKPKNGEYK